MIDGIRGKKFLILGIGNELKGDDRAGPYIVSKLKTKNKINCGEVPENFIGKIKKINPEVIVIIDAVDFEAKTGEIVIDELKDFSEPTLSTHSPSLKLFCSFFPDTKFYLIGIKPKGLGFGEEMSEEVKKSADEIIEKLNRFL